jgi:hypothetical protein
MQLVSELLQSFRARFPGRWLKTLAVELHARFVNVQQSLRSNTALVCMHFAIILLQRRSENKIGCDLERIR